MILDEMEARDQIGPAFPIVCPRHPEQARLIFQPGEIPLHAPNGGCVLPCDARLPCGHICPSVVCISKGKERKESYIAHAMISVTLCWTTTVVSSVRPYVIVHLAHEGILVPSGVLMNVANATSLCIKYPFHVATSLQRFHGSFGI